MRDAPLCSPRVAPRFPLSDSQKGPPIGREPSGCRLGAELARSAPLSRAPPPAVRGGRKGVGVRQKSRRQLGAGRAWLLVAASLCRRWCSRSCCGLCRSRRGGGRAWVPPPPQPASEASAPPRPPRLPHLAGLLPFLLPLRLSAHLPPFASPPRLCSRIPWLPPPLPPARQPAPSPLPAVAPLQLANNLSRRLCPTEAGKEDRWKVDLVKPRFGPQQTAAAAHAPLSCRLCPPRQQPPPPTWM